MFAGTSSDKDGNWRGNEMFPNSTEQQRERPASSCSSNKATGKQRCDDYDTLQVPIVTASS